VETAKSAALMTRKSVNNMTSLHHTASRASDLAMQDLAFLLGRAEKQRDVYRELCCLSLGQLHTAAKRIQALEKQLARVRADNYAHRHPSRGAA
jgi:hypothetical protein